MQKSLIEIRASELRTEWDLSPYDPIALKQLLLKLNILTLFKPLGDSLSGMCLKRNNHKFILINANHPLGRQHFTIGHELYHLYVQETFDIHFCDPGSNLSIKQERDADYFSSVLLMPEMGIKKMIPTHEIAQKKISLPTLLKLEHFFAVSRSALLVRLSALKLISKEQYNQLKGIPVIHSALEHGYDTALYRPGNERLVIGDYGVKARSLFEEGLISEGHYVELLSKIGIDPMDVNDE